MRSDPRLPWAVLLVAALLSIVVYREAFTFPMWLPRYYSVPHMDTPKLLGVSPTTLGGFALAIGLLFVFYLAAFRASFSLRTTRSAAGVLALSVLLSLPLLLMYPGGAGDLFAYIAEADIVLRYNSNPFTSPVSAFPNHPLLPYVDFPQETTHYGPLWLVIGVLLRGMAGGDLLTAVLVFKSASAVFLMATALLVYLTLRRERPEVAVRSTLLVAWNPLLLFELAGNGHNDVAMMLLAILAFYLLQRGRQRLAITSLLAASLVKYVAVILVPLFLVAMFRRAGPPRAWLPSALLYGIGVAMVAGALVDLIGMQGTVGMLQRQSRWFTSSLPAVAYHYLSLSMPREAVAGIVGLGYQLLFGAIYLAALGRVWLRPWSLVETSFFTMLALMAIATSWFQPWYVTWVIPLAALTATPVSHAATLGLTLGAFTIHLVMGFAWRLNWNRGSVVGINLAATALTWAPALSAMIWAGLRLPLSGKMALSALLRAGKVRLDHGPLDRQGRERKRKTRKTAQVSRFLRALRVSFARFVIQALPRRLELPIPWPRWGILTGLSSRAPGVDRPPRSGLSSTRKQRLTWWSRERLRPFDGKGGTMKDIHYDRICRTPRSEAYLISQGEEPIARVELHFTHAVVHGLLVVEKGLDEKEIVELIQLVDKNLVWSADLPREDFVVTVYQGRQLGVYSDPDLGEGEETERQKREGSDS